MSKNEAFWFFLFLTGMALIGAERGWKGIAWNIGIGICGWCVGHVFRSKR